MLLQPIPAKPIYQLLATSDVLLATDIDQLLYLRKELLCNAKVRSLRSAQMMLQRAPSDDILLRVKA